MVVDARVSRGVIALEIAETFVMRFAGPSK